MTSVYAATLLVFLVIVSTSRVSGIAFHAVVSDTYEATGTRFTGLVSFWGILVWCCAASVCLLSASALPSDTPCDRRWRRFLACSGAIAMLLLLDDFLAFHEIVDNALEIYFGFDASRVFKTVTETTVFAVYGAIFLAYVWSFRQLIATTRYGVLVLSVSLFLISHGFDVVPRTIPGIGRYATVIEETSKLFGVVTFATYYAGVAADRLRAGIVASGQRQGVQS